MAKWEYAAIVRDGKDRITLKNGQYRIFTKWALVKPGKEPYTIRWDKDPKYARIYDSGYSWAKPFEYAINREKDESQGFEYNNSEPEILFAAHDILVLVNLAGAHGWEITGGLGLANSSQSNSETKWRIMRRELLDS